VALGAGAEKGTGKNDEGSEGVFISTRLLSDRFSLAFELFINVGHAFVDAAGVPESFSELAWNQAVTDVRGETSLDAWECRAQAVGGGQNAGREGGPKIDEKARTEFIEAAFSDAIATTPSCANASILCWRRRRWPSGCGWWRGCFRPMQSTSSPSGIAEGREARWGATGKDESFAGRKGRAVVVGWTSSGSFDCARRKVRGVLRSG
jgi:hypothetical protein